MVKKMGLIILASLFLCIGSAYADPIYLDVGDYGDSTGALGTDTNTETGVFEQMQFYAETTTTQYGTIDPDTLAPTVGSTFSDDGNLVINSLLGTSAVDDEFLDLGYQITGTWSDLTGEITSSDIQSNDTIVQNTSYDSGTIIYLYIDDVIYDWGADNAVGGSGDDTGFDEGDLIAEITITGGTGTNTFDDEGNFLTGSSIISGEFTWLLEEFWYTEAEVDLYDLLSFGWTINADVDQNTDKVTIIAGEDTNDPNDLFQINSNHDGSINVSVVPEPTTIMLFGLGLLSIAGIGRRRKA